MLQFVFVWIPPSLYTFLGSVVVDALHNFSDFYILFLALFRTRTYKNALSAAGLTAVT
jgi:hypothetical protein